MGKYHPSQWLHVPLHVPPWVQGAIDGSGSYGLFVLSFLDSTFLPFPSLNDFVLLNLSIKTPERMVFYVLVSTIGSTLGCLLLYYIGLKGGEVAFHAKAGAAGPRVRRWLERNGFISLLVAGLLPPPMPFKIFVLAAGVLGMPLRAFLLAVLLARALRFYGEGYLAIRYGNQAFSYLMIHKGAVAVVTLVVVLLLYLIFWLVFRRQQQEV